MNAPAHRIHVETTGLPAGEVRLRRGDRYAVAVDDREVLARRAASCLLEPEPGDRVLLTLSPEPFVLAVLERAPDRPATLSVDGDATLKASGRLTLEGDQGITARTREALCLLSGSFKLRSGTAEIASEALTAVAKRVRAHVEDSGVVSKTLDVVAERLTQKAARAYRNITEMDQLRARHFDYRADHAARISAENTVVTAREVVKVDGEQVHIG